VPEDRPEVNYARSADVAIAYQVVGDSPVDLVFCPWFGNLVWAWQQPRQLDLFRRLSAFSRLILFDRRGTGLSDRPREVTTLETRMDDIRAVLDAVESERAAVLGSTFGGQVAALFAATYPERTTHLVLYNTPRAWSALLDDPTSSEEDARRYLREVREQWGEYDYHAGQIRDLAPSDAADPEFVRWWVDFQRLALSPGAAAIFSRTLVETDVTEVLSAIRVPTLVLYRARTRALGLDVGRRIDGARAVELPGAEQTIWSGPELSDEIQHFVLGEEKEAVPDRVLTTVLFTDIAGSTQRAAELGDRAWRDLLDTHQRAVRRELARFRGLELDTAGDGFFATFDGPARGVVCARSIVALAREVGLQVRAGLHTGECELHGKKVSGIAVHIGARVAANAGPGEVLVSSTVKDLVAGSGISFADRGVVELKGVPGEWRLYSVAD
jgi:class 3 adenylate cyclase